jgi:hypothetical protein
MRGKQSAMAAKSFGGAIIIVWSCLLPLCCLSFHMTTHQPAPRQPLPSKPSRNRVLIRSTKSSITDTTDYSSIYNLEEECDISSNLIDNTCSNNGVEIWLDLRGTSLSPSTALELWEIEQQQDGATAVPFTKCLVSPPSDISNNNNSNSPQKSNNNGMNVLLAAGNDQIIMESSQTSSSWGKILPLETSAQSIPMLPDPLPAMDIISQGKWIILDTTRGWKKVEEEERLSFLLPLAELISSGAIPATGGKGNGGGGGIGLTCHTKNEVVKVAMWIQSITNNRSGQKSVRTKTLENGLVIPDDDDFDASVAFDSSQGLQYAIVVPYDVGLLKTASMLLSNE